MSEKRLILWALLVLVKQPRPQFRVLQDVSIHHISRSSAGRYGDHGTKSAFGVVAEELISPADGMRRHDDGVECQQRMVPADWLLGEHVERGARDAPFGERCIKGLLVHDRAAGGIDEVRGWLHQR